jgi:hypothetical protein
LEGQIPLTVLTQVSRSQTYAKQTFRGVAHCHFPLNELCPHKGRSLGFYWEHRDTKLLPPGCPAHRLKLLNALTTLTPPTVTLVWSFTVKWMYLHEPVQGLNLNPLYITGPVVPVTTLSYYAHLLPSTVTYIFIFYANILYIFLYIYIL